MSLIIHIYVYEPAGVYPCILYENMCAVAANLYLLNSLWLYEPLIIHIYVYEPAGKSFSMDLLISTQQEL